MSFAASVADRLVIQPTPTAAGPFHNGATSGTQFADFDQSYDAIARHEPAIPSAAPVATLLGAPGIPRLRIGGSPYWEAYRDYGDLDSFGTWLTENKYVGGDQLNRLYARDLIAGTDTSHLEGFVLPVLERFAPTNADTAQVRDAVRAHIDGLNSLADRAAWDVTSAGLNADAPTAAYRMFVDREWTWSNGITVGTSAIPIVGRGAGKILGRIISREAAPGARVFRGGAYGRLPGGPGIERHHLPADSVSPFTRYSGPAIEMERADHLLTSSHGSQGLEGALYRSEIKDLIDGGQMRNAMAREIVDVRRAAVLGGGSATKYNGAIREMLGYSYKKGWLGK